ncbi:MAG: uroporphyrinogen decarboxylase [Actinomycetota bacterium]|nr:uroporphyrinogen decarboxylase [Actinomycetota bacterium]
MRQAGRYLPEYREVRGDRDILETCKDAELVVEITLQPLRRMPVDAAILFSDIMVPLAAIGVPVRIEPGRGPVVTPPIRTMADVERLRPLEPESDVPEMLEAIALLRAELEVPLIGFAGAPFTLASYLIEGGPSKNHERTKALLFGEPAIWEALMRRLTDIVSVHLLAQARAGAQVLQVFDSWVGALHPDVYRRAVQPYVREVFQRVRAAEVPTIHFGVGTGELLPLMVEGGGDAIGIDFKTPLDAGWSRAGGPAVCAVQGNLDPAALLALWEATEGEVRAVLAAAEGRDGHIFNLGHGVLPETDVAQLQRVVDLVHTETERVPQ